MAKNMPANAGEERDAGQNLGQVDPLEEGMTTRYSSISAWRSSQMEESGRVQSIRLQRVGHN